MKSRTLAIPVLASLILVGCGSMPALKTGLARSSTGRSGLYIDMPGQGKNLFVFPKSGVQYLNIVAQDEDIWKVVWGLNPNSSAGARFEARIELREGNPKVFWLKKENQIETWQPLDNHVGAAIWVNAQGQVETHSQEYATAPL